MNNTHDPEASGGFVDFEQYINFEPDPAEAAPGSSLHKSSARNTCNEPPGFQYVPPAQGEYESNQSVGVTLCPTEMAYESISVGIATQDLPGAGSATIVDPRSAFEMELDMLDTDNLMPAYDSTQRSVAVGEGSPVRHSMETLWRLASSDDTLAGAPSADRALHWNLSAPPDNVDPLPSALEYTDPTVVGTSSQLCEAQALQPDTWLLSSCASEPNHIHPKEDHQKPAQDLTAQGVAVPFGPSLPTPSSSKAKNSSSQLESVALQLQKQSKQSGIPPEYLCAIDCSTGSITGRTPEAQANRDKVTATGGQCFLCRFRRKKCSGERPCKACEQFLVKYSSSFKWTCNVYNDLADLNFFQLDDDGPLSYGGLTRNAKAFFTEIKSSDELTGSSIWSELLVLHNSEPTVLRSETLCRYAVIFRKLEKQRGALSYLSPPLRRCLEQAKNLYRYYGTAWFVFSEAFDPAKNRYTAIAILLDIALFVEYFGDWNSDVVKHIREIVLTRLRILLPEGNDTVSLMGRDSMEHWTFDDIRGMLKSPRTPRGSSSVHYEWREEHKTIQQHAHAWPTCLNSNDTTANFPNQTSRSPPRACFCGYAWHGAIRPIAKLLSTTKQGFLLVFHGQPEDCPIPPQAHPALALCDLFKDPQTSSSSVNSEKILCLQIAHRELIMVVLEYASLSQKILGYEFDRDSLIRQSYHNLIMALALRWTATIARSFFDYERERVRQAVGSTDTIITFSVWISHQTTLIQTAIQELCGCLEPCHLYLKKGSLTVQGGNIVLLPGSAVRNVRLDKLKPVPITAFFRDWDISFEFGEVGQLVPKFTLADR